MGDLSGCRSPRGAMEAPELAGGGANAIRRAVLIGTGSPGSENQCVALVRALGIASDNLTVYRVTRPGGGINDWLGVIPVSLHKLIDKLLVRPFSRRAGTNTPQKHVPNGGLAALSPSVPEADAKEIVAAARDTFDKEGPTLVIACGQETISCSALIRKLAPDCVFVIQVDIMLKMRLFFEIIRMRHPRFRPERFDLVVAPRHDYYTSTAKGGHQQEVPSLLQRWIFPREQPPKNLMFTVGALHQADPAALRLAHIAWRDELAPLTKPLLIVNVGGPTKKCTYGADLATQLVTSLYNVLDSCGSVRISFSRKTPQKIADVILQEFAGHPKVYIWDNQVPSNKRC
ncbi:mitochondrial fission protein ELM1-like [Panicum virgatum]|uniref:Mitochondrial fission protein ELM1 n=1 Tax=Panicum virgatum TaxID=38727 RepID=A0A8T0PCZ4_PANVG|nr:mitochondrial fission protein ELM1-like [Panicum virgatum]KAG2558529.1 hypothetical protein PVAP13_8NG273100 [Panicum virgatum]